MGAIVVRVENARRQPLNDQIDITIVSAHTGGAVRSASGLNGAAAHRFEGLLDRQPYIVQVFPRRHRPVAQFVFAGTDAEPSRAVLNAPLDPDKVRVTFPAYTELSVQLQDVLERSEVPGIDAQGEALYGALEHVQKAGLLNLFAKMSGVAFDDGRTVWSYVSGIFGIRADRIFIDVEPELRERVEEAVPTGRFRPVSGKLHEPPQGFSRAGSFKSSEPYGNLQLTFFATIEPPLAYKVDADIDDAAGLGHAFQVIRNFVTRGTTHPYDIHQILVFRQDVALPYDLA